MRRLKRETEEESGQVAFERITSVIDYRAAIIGGLFMLMLGAHEEAYASASPVRRPLGRKLIDKEGISKEEMSGIVDEAGALLSQGIVSMHQALQLLPWLRKDLRRCDKGRERLGGVDGQELGS